MNKELLRIRLLQFTRIINSLGIGRFLFLAILFFFFIAGTYTYSVNQDGTIFLSAIYFTIILTIHFKRDDHMFLKCHVEQFRIVYIQEYLILSLPLTISIIIHGHFLIASLLLISLPILSIITIKKRSLILNTRFERLIPAAIFEWKAGMRSNYIVLTLVWLISLITSFWVGSIPIAILVIGLLVVNYNNRMESLPMLLAFEYNSRKFLYTKVRLNLLVYSILLLPLLITFLIIHANYWYISMILYALACLLITYSIFLKYSFYEPNVNVTVNQTFIALGATGILLPAFFPMTIALLIRFYFRAIKNLNFYLNDYN